MPDLMLSTALDQLTFDVQTGALLSLSPLAAPQTNLLVPGDDHPAFVLQHLVDGEYLTLDSRSAQLTVALAGDSLTLTFSRVGGLDLTVTIAVAASPADRFSRWTATVTNDAGLQIVDLQFPFVVLPNRPDATVLMPNAQGHLIEGPHLPHLPEDTPRQWQFWPENGNSQHYPGRSFAQFMAWYADGRGFYTACDDTQGHVKLLRALRRPEGLRLGFAHVGDWPSGGVRTLEYSVLLGSFEGDWYDAADRYRDWALQQHWATPLTGRTDIPAWLLESPPHITIRLQGYVDDGVAPPIEQFLPYEKCIPLLAGVAEAVDSPVVAVLMSWERGGPWVYPDCFPPVGGDESLSNFCRLARERGWHVGSFCNGTRWVMKHLFNGYDGQAYWEAHNGRQGVCRQPNGELWHEHWDQNWRPSYITCLGERDTQRIARDFVRRLIGWGMESIQFFDQNCNASTFPCFSTAHGHAPLPGKWMAQAMADIIGQFHAAAAEAGEAEVIHSTEWPTNEFCLPLFQQSDLRLSVPTSGDSLFVPIYQYLYHECTLTHGMMSFGPEPYSVPARTAWECVWGEIVGAVLTGDGTLLNRETVNWAEWEPKVGSDEDALEMMRTATALRRGAGRDFLVYGRMQRPAPVDCEICEWDWNGKHHTVPAVAHCAWQSPDGRHGIALANWTTEPRTIRITDPRLGPAPTLHVCARTNETSQPEGSTLTLPPLSCAILEQ